MLKPTQQGFVKHSLVHAGARADFSGLPELQDLPDPWLADLVQDKLTAQDRLQLFGASKATAAVVARQADSIQLTLSTVHDAQGGKEQLQAQLAVLESILEAAGGTPLYVVLQNPHEFRYLGCLPVRWGLVPKAHVVCLTVQGANLGNAFTSTCPLGSAVQTGASISQGPAQTLASSSCLLAGVGPTVLGLQDCLWLHTLVLGEGCYWESPACATALLQQRQYWAPSALTCLDIQEGCSDEAADIIVQLLGPRISHLYCSKMLTDGWLLALTPQPKLTHVTARGLDIHMDHTRGYQHQDGLPECMQQDEQGGGHLQAQVGHSCQQGLFKCEQLKLTQEASIEALLRLPLQNIKQLVIRGALKYEGKQPLTVDQLQQLARSPSLQCVPLQHDIQGFAEPLFAVTGNVGTALLRMCINGLTTTCALYLCDCTRASMTSLLPCLRQLPSTVVALGFQFPGGEADGFDSLHCLQFWRGVVTNLPPHVDCVLLQPRRQLTSVCIFHFGFLLDNLAFYHPRPDGVSTMVHLVLEVDDPRKKYFQEYDGILARAAAKVTVQVLHCA